MGDTALQAASWGNMTVLTEHILQTQVAILIKIHRTLVLLLSNNDMLNFNLKIRAVLV